LQLGEEQGVASAVLQHIIAFAQSRGISRPSLRRVRGIACGLQLPASAATVSLNVRHIAGYAPDPNSISTARSAFWSVKARTGVIRYA
jgi:hypothetical protein